MKKKFVISFFMAIMYFIIISRVEATGSVSLSASKTNVNIGDTFTINVNLSGVSVASLTSRISVDTQKVDYVSGPANSNFSNGRAIYTWTDLTGGASPLTGGTIASFTFKAKAEGTASFGISGDFFTPEETSASPAFSGVSVTINNPQPEVNPPEPQKPPNPPAPPTNSTPQNQTTNATNTTNITNTTNTTNMTNTTNTTNTVTPPPVTNTVNNTEPPIRWWRAK